MPLPPVAYEPPGLGRARKIALIGTAQTHVFAPWHDPSWEIWAHASSWRLCRRVDRFFDLHSRKVWSAKKYWHPDYQAWLKKLPVPIYMQERYADVPQSVRYPRERVLSEYRRYLTSQAAWMMALALTEGVTHLGFFGIHYSSDEEHRSQRPGCEYWMGVAEGKGVQLVIPSGCPLLTGKGYQLYGYESHPNGYVPKQAKEVKDEMPPDPPALTVLDPAHPEAWPRLAPPHTGESIPWERSGLPPELWEK